MIHLITLFEEYPPAIQLLIYSILGNVALIGIIVMILMGFILAPEARFFFMARFKRGGAVLEAVDPSGGVVFKMVKADSNMGTLKGNNRLYIFIHKLLKLDSSGLKVQEAEGLENKRKYNELLQKRNILIGIGKPLYHGLTGASIAGTPKVVAEIEKARLQAQLTGGEDPGPDELDRRLLSMIKKERPYEAVIVTPFNIEQLAEYARISFSPYDIQTAWDEGYLAGLNVKPPGQINWIWWIIIILGLVGLVVAFTLYGGGAPAG